jgi:hypothetical protein
MATCAPEGGGLVEGEETESGELPARRGSCPSTSENPKILNQPKSLTEKCHFHPRDQLTAESGFDLLSSPLAMFGVYRMERLFPAFHFT